MTEDREITIRMPKKSLKKWLKALRTGGYEQVKGTLYNPSEQGFCCLGVLQHCLSGGYVEIEENYFGQEIGFASVPGEQWLDSERIIFLGPQGDKGSNPHLPTIGVSAAEFNDDGATFAQIADAIEACAEDY